MLHQHYHVRLEQSQYSDAMHSSSSSQRPRQRTFTSCTECRRRKQRCNQAKDRPCNNCSRRYPPVVCTYESSSPPPSHDRLVDLRDGQSSTRYHGDTHQSGSSSTNSSNSYQQHPQSYADDHASTTSSSMDYYGTQAGYAYNPTATSRSDYRGAYSSTDTSSAQYASTPTSSSGDYLNLDDGYYASDPQLGYGVQEGHDYYAASGAQQGSWLAAAGDPGAFVGGNDDYYYVCDDQDQLPRTTRG